MKTITISILMAIAGFFLAYFIFAEDDNITGKESTAIVQQYTCGMHPEIISDEPGYCPLCSMKLTPKKDGSSTATGGILIDPTTSQNMGVVTSIAKFQNLAKTIKSFGRVAYSEPNLYSINLKVEGWAERLYANETGMTISKGQPLFEIYSPQLIAAQEEYFNAKRQAENNSPGGASSILSAAKKRLSNWDISDEQIEALSKASNIQRTLIIRSPADGIIVSKNIIEGEAVKPGKELYKIADLSKVWVEAYIYEQDVPFLSLGQPAVISIPNLSDKRFKSNINYISPFLNSKRQVEIRFALDNPNNLLRPDMYAEVSVESKLDGDRLVIPYSAVIHSGTKNIVYIKGDEDSYQPRIISAGVLGNDDMIEVISGVDEGDLVVTSGQFMLDSESRLNEALAGGVHVGHDHFGDDHSSSKNQMQMSPAEEKGLSGVYTCPMPEHFHIVQYGEGECPECGMNLMPIEETDNKTAYVCPMRECGVADAKPGKCSKCNMNLVELELGRESDKTNRNHSTESHTEMMDHDPDEMIATGGHDIYTCPMPVHYNQLQYGKGDCSECGMKLVPLGETDNNKVYVCPMSECETVQDHKGTCAVCGMNLVRYQAEDPEETDAE